MLAISGVTPKYTRTIDSIFLTKIPSAVEKFLQLRLDTKMCTSCLLRSAKKRGGSALILLRKRRS